MGRIYVSNKQILRTLYVGHTTQYQAVVDYIAPHLEAIPSLLRGLNLFLLLTHPKTCGFQ